MLEFVKPEEIKDGDEILCNGAYLRVLSITIPPDDRGRRGTRVFELAGHRDYEAGYLFKVPRRRR